MSRPLRQLLSLAFAANDTRSRSCSIKICRQAGVAVVLKKAGDLRRRDPTNREIRRDLRLTEKCRLACFVVVQGRIGCVVQQVAAEKQLVSAKRKGRMPLLVAIINGKHLDGATAIA